MSATNAIAIPKRSSGKQRASHSQNSLSHSTATGRSLHSNNSSAFSSPASDSAPLCSPGMGGLSAREKGKMPMREGSGTWLQGSSSWGPERRQSLLSSSISRCEHTVVNIGDPDGPPRLITCVKASQGFDWNQDIFLPSYASDHDYTADLERRQDPVEDIFITEEEAEEMFPR